MAYEETRNFLLSRLPKQAVGAEIGVWQGDFSARILEKAQPRLLHLIDPWLHRTDPSHANALYGRAQQEQMDQLHSAVCSKFAAQMASGQVCVHRTTSADAMGKLTPESLDYVYIDGDHAFEGVSADLELSFTRVRPGGLICVDDHVLGKWWGDGVVRAVNMFLGAHAAELELVMMHNWQVVIRKRPPPA